MFTFCRDIFRNTFLHTGASDIKLCLGMAFLENPVKVNVEHCILLLHGMPFSIPDYKLFSISLTSSGRPL